MYKTEIQNQIQLEFCKLMSFLLYFDSLVSIQGDIQIFYYMENVASIFLYVFKITVVHTIYK